MLRWSMRHAFVVLILLVLASCSGGGGCSSGCASCGTTPLPAGFPQASIIPNSASMRVTRTGLDFVAANIGNVAAKMLGGNGGTGGVAHFNIPTSVSKNTILFFNITVTICPNGPDPNSNPPKCIADIDLGHAALHVDSITAHSVKINGTVPIRVQDLPVNATLLGDFDVGVGEGVNGSQCNGGTPTVDWTQVPVDIELPLVTETLSPRDGYTKIDADNAVINVNVDKSKIAICKGCGIAQPICDWIFGTIKDFAYGQLVGGVTGQLKTQLKDGTCTKPVPTETPQCPTGTQPDGNGKYCVFTSDPNTCVPMLLGTDAHMNLAHALASISPGTTGGVDFVLAAGGDMDPAPGCAADTTYDPQNGCQADPSPPYPGHTPNGITLGMLGGMLPNPTTSCVPIAENPLPQGIPIPDEITRDKVSPWPQGDNGPDIGLAIAGRYLNYAATAAYNSGVLCLGVSTEQFQALNTGYVSAVIPSLKDLTFEPGKLSKSSALAITTRPQHPPVIKLGNGTDIKKDPLLTITLKQFAIDFYVWNYDRFVRAFTYTADLTIPVNLQTGKDPKTNPNGGILPVLGSVGTANGTVTNSDLIWENPAIVSNALSALLGGIAGQFLGNGFKPIDLTNALKQYGVGLTIPTGGFRKLTKGTDDFLGLFADLTQSTGQAHMQVDTQARLLDVTVHPEAMGLANADPEKFPRVRLALASPQDDGRRAIEYTWWIDDQPHAAWTAEREVTVDSPYLFLQGKHVLYASARVAGQMDSEDETPAEVPFAIDVLAPYVWLEPSESGVTAVRAYDFVSPESELRARVRLTDARGTLGEWSEWGPLGTLDAIDTSHASSIDAQVMDAKENVGSVSQAIIRGRPDPTLKGTGGCGCTAAGAKTDLRVGIAASGAVLFALLALALRRRRHAKSVLVLGSLGLVASTSQGCACGGDGQGSGTGCGPTCNDTCGTSNAQGLIGAYTSVAVAKDGSTWVAGYNDADVTNGMLYGDLVAGKYDSGHQQVQWTTVDGLPAARTDGSCPPNDPQSWRRGETDPGPDVGLWTSIAIADDGSTPMISYYDATNSALKFASSSDGGATWASHTVKQASITDAGRYSKMIVVAGKPVIAFLVKEKGNGGYARSRVVLATGTASVPQSATEWSFQDAVVDEQSPCRAEFCDSGQVCVNEPPPALPMCQPKVGGCTPADCNAGGGGLGGGSQACVTISGKATCQAILDDTYIDTYPDAAGDYVAMANGPQGLGIVVYDRTRGNLVGVANSQGKWVAQILDGQTGANNDPNRKDTGDVGVGASIAIGDNGDWHVSYVNGFTEAVEYLNVPGGNLQKPLAPEVVDDGTKLSGQAFPDGLHVVGDDSSITVDGAGTVRIVYQDATSGTLREAIGTPGGGKHAWAVKALSQANKFAGFFPHYVAQSQMVANWFRATDHTQTPPLVSGDVAFVAP